MVCFDPQVSIADSLDSNKENDASLVSEFFGERPTTGESSWDSIIFESTKSEVRSGLKEDLRQSLLSKFELKEDLAGLGPPKLNSEIKAALSKHHSVLKRDEYQCMAQLQVGACLNALGSGFSDLLRILQGHPIQAKVKASITKLTEGIHLLADQYRLSLARQSVVKPCLTYVGKSAADQSLVDEWLFGSAFAEGLKSAQACEKAGKDLSRFTSDADMASKPRHQPLQQQPAKQLPAYTGNSRTPSLEQTPLPHRSRATRKLNRSRSPLHRSRFQARVHR